MKTIIKAIHPKWCEKILNGEKTIELGKGFGNMETPVKVLMYCTKPKEKIRCGQFPSGYTDELYKLPNGEIKFGDSIELMCWKPDSYTRNNFLNGKVVGEFICRKITKIAYPIENNPREIQDGSCLTREEILQYSKNETAIIFALHISEVKIYAEPKELSEFYITKKCVPVNSYFGDKQNWDDRHKRCSASLPRESWGIPIECHRCKNLYVAKEPYLDEKSGCMLFDYDCKTKYHKPIARAPQNYCYCEELEE